MRIGPASALSRKRSQAFPGKNLSYLNGVSLLAELADVATPPISALPAIQSFINLRASQFHAVTMNNYSPGTIMPVGPQNTQIGRFTVNGVTFYYSPARWPAGGGGLATLPPDKAAALGGIQVTVPPTMGGGGYGGGAAPPIPTETGYVFAYNPGGALAPGAANPHVAYTPGTGGDFVKTVAPLAIIAALPFAAAAITAAAAGAAGSGAAAGAVMPGAEAAASGATGGIITSGSAAGSALVAPAAETAAAGAIMPGAEAVASGATGGIVSAGGATTAAATGLTTSGVVGAVKTAAGLAQQAKQIYNMVEQHANAANSLAQTAQQQADAGNVAAAAALQDQSQQNALMAQQYQQQLQNLGLGTSIGGVPLWALLAGGAVLLVVLTASLSKRK